MLSISKLGGAGQAASYYEKSDYYTNGEKRVDIESSWSGGLAKEFGLDGPVSKKEFTKLLNGELPDGKVLGTVREGKNQHTPGWDLTFSAPKSASVLSLVGGDKDLIKAHQEAVNTTLEYIEKNILNGRIRVEGQTIPVDIKKALFAQFTHTTSRKLDPMLHTHVVLLNAGVDKHGKARSIQSKAVFDAKMLLGQIYRNDYAGRASALGYNIEWDSKKGLFEIGGVDKELLSDLSKRGNEVKRLAKEKGVDSAKELEKIAVSSRDAKQNIKESELKESWDKQVSERGYTSDSLVSDAKGYAVAYKKETKLGILNGGLTFKNEAMAATKNAVKQLSHYESAFKAQDLLRETLMFTGGRITFEEISDCVDKLTKSGEIIVSKNRKGMLTTKDAVQREKAILKLEVAGRDTQTAISDHKGVESLLKDMNFTPGQAEGLRHLMLNTDRFTAIQGHAGVGKTTMLAPLVKYMESKGYEIHAVAPYGKAARVLGGSLQIKANTLKSLLMEFQRDANKNNSQYGARSADESKRIYIVDESSTINSRDMLALQKAVSERGGRVFFSGDRIQSGGVEAGKDFAQLQDNGMSTSINTDIVRQKKGTKLHSAIESHYNRDFNKAFESLSDRIVEQPNRGKRLDQFAQDYVRLSNNNPSHVGVVMDNQTRGELTDRIRDLLREEGRIGKDELAVKTYVGESVDAAKKSMAQFYEPGMVVRFLQDYKRLGVNKDEYFKVLTSNTREVTLTDGHRTFKWRPDKVGGNNEFGGVSTYSEEKRRFSIGDIIRFKDRNKENDYINGTEGKVVGIKNGLLVIEEVEKGGRLTLDPNNHRDRHFEHAYLSTAYIAQGMTGKTAQVMAVSTQKNLLNDSSFLVAITRPQENITIYMDSKEKVLEAVSERSGIKQGALDHQVDTIRTERALKMSTSHDRKPSVPMDTFVSKPADIPKDMPEQVQREKTFLP